MRSIYGEGRKEEKKNISVSMKQTKVNLNHSIIIYELIKKYIFFKSKAN